MAKTRVFHSFHFDNDCMRTQQIRNIGAIEGDQPVQSTEWEMLKRTGDDAVKRWINNTMDTTRCAIVLIGAETAGRKWINYEIERAWNTGKGLFGIYIHNLRDPRYGTSNRGQDPFAGFTLQNGTRRLSDAVRIYDPDARSAYQEIADNMEAWVNRAIADRR